jgi:quercetin dioxygenase-like cupin family protein
MPIDERERSASIAGTSLPLEKITEMVSRKIVSGTREMVAQHTVKKGALVPVHAHESEQMTYVLQGALRAWSTAKR